MKLALAIFAVAAVAATTSQAALTYDAVADCDGTSNPSGAWTYLSAAAENATPTPLPFATFHPAGSQGGAYAEYGNGLTLPNSVAVDRDFGPGSVTFPTIVVPTNLLRVDPQNLADFVRWTAPATGTYAVAGLFQLIDTTPHAPEFDVLRDDNSTQPILGAVPANLAFGGQTPFGFTAAFSAGETLDFVVSARSGDYTHLSTGLSATITAVPEPATVWAAAGVAGSVIAAGRRRKSVRPQVASWAYRGGRLSGGDSRAV